MQMLWNLKNNCMQGLILLGVDASQLKKKNLYANASKKQVNCMISNPEGKSMT